ncbi:hypothetical protein B0H16DRAFT_1512346 [Mycena metata]|uniref:EthD domain-containing protein n=2 Tax=Mycena TaxID=41247 RepID=A0AAD7NT41_9AGAR|nr:hypothetical protein C8F04DRAFT_1113405 [Mycena alexandri]KAJ7773437.1 hypothetical protein B0H16DRAFT_1512346 [Mycena metata]
MVSACSDIRTDRVRLAVLLRRKPDLSSEEFHEYWAGPHRALFSSLKIVQSNLTKYEQAHMNDNIFQQTAGAMGAPPSQWDGVAIFEGESYAKIFEIFQNEEYLTKVIPDEANFFIRDQSQVLPLDLITVFEK